MRYGSDLGWWGRHPYLYAAFTTGAALGCLVVLIGATTGAEPAVGVALTAGLFGALMTVASVYSWHWLLKGRHRDRAANDRARWRFDRRLLKAGWALLWLVFAFLVLAASAGLYTAWRLDRYGVAAQATVNGIEDDTVTVSFAGPAGMRRGELRTEEADLKNLDLGDRLTIVYDPDPAFTEVVFSDRSPYGGWPIGIGVGAVVAGALLLAPAARRRINDAALRHWRGPDGRLKPPGEREPPG